MDVLFHLSGRGNFQLAEVKQEEVEKTHRDVSLFFFVRFCGG